MTAPTPFRLLVTGSRELTDAKLVEQQILDIWHAHQVDGLTIVVGDCPTGADLFARQIAAAMSFTLEVHRADWQAHGKAAGPRRNQAMVDSGADLCLGFLKADAGNRGTHDCLRRARAAGIPTFIHVERSTP